MKLCRRRLFLIAGAVMLAALGLLLTIPRLRAALRWTGGFSRHAPESRLYFERGAERQADQIAAALPAAVQRVEAALGRPFVSPFRVYLCASHESFARRLGLPVLLPVRGLALARDVWLTPLIFDYHGQDTHAGSLIHELVHLYFAQRLNWLHRLRTSPTWFNEGLADRVAGTGFEVFSRQEALAAVASGRRFEPDLTGRLPRPRGPHEYGLPAPLLHAQARLFVEFLEATDADAFHALIAAMLTGEPFATAFATASQRPLADLWAQFLDRVMNEPRQDRVERKDSAGVPKAVAP